MSQVDAKANGNEAGANTFAAAERIIDRAYPEKGALEGIVLLKLVLTQTDSIAAALQGYFLAQAKSNRPGTLLGLAEQLDKFTEAMKEIQVACVDTLKPALVKTIQQYAESLEAAKKE